MNARSQAIEEARRDLRTRAGRAEAEADALRHELAGLRTAAETSAAETQASGRRRHGGPGLDMGGVRAPGRPRAGGPHVKPGDPVPSRNGDPSR